MKKIAMTLLALSISSAYAAGQTYDSREDAMKAAGLEAMTLESNIELVKKAQANFEIYKNELGQEFGGLWIEYEKDGNPSVVLGSTGENRISKTASLDSGIKTKTVKFALTALNAAQQSIGNTYYLDSLNNPEEHSDLLSTFVDIPNNKIVVTAKAEKIEKLKSWIITKGFTTDMIDFQEQEEPVSFHAKLVGGDAIFTGQAHNVSGCSSGFNVTIDGFISGAITAGHCALLGQGVFFNLAGNPGTGVIQGPYIGAFLANEYNNGIDAVLFGNENNAHQLPNAIHTTNSFSEVPVKSVQAVDSLLIGAPICRHGAVTLWKCGTLTAYNSMEFVPPYRPMVYSLASFCGAGGDSGGPVVTDAFPNMNAIGIYGGVKGSAGQKGSCGAVIGGGTAKSSIFTSLTPYLARYPNVKVLTTNP